MTAQDSIQDILMRTKLFNQISKKQVEELCLNTTMACYYANDLIVSEGDIGDVLYIILEGSVRVFTHNKKGEEVVLARLEKGNYFGEQALLSPKPIRRNATVRALTPVTVLTITHEVFQNVLKSNEKLMEWLQEYGHHQLIDKLLRQLETHGDNQKKLLGVFTNVKHFEKREVYFREGSLPTHAYYLLSGTVTIIVYDKKYRVKHHRLVYPGQFFGHLEVIENTQRNSLAFSQTDSTSAVIDANKFRQFYLENHNLNNLINFSHLYSIPSVGVMTQYSGNFLGHPSWNTMIQKQNGEIIITARLFNSNIFSVYYSDLINPTKKFFYKDKNHFREILIEDNKLVGVMSVGEWEDLDELVFYLCKKPMFHEKDITNFVNSGELGIHYPPSHEEILCECMQVKTEDIQKLIQKGITKLEGISKRTAAGTVCGGCLPRIKELLGEEAWTFVKIIDVQEHNETIRSYLLQPISSRVMEAEAGQHIIVAAHRNGLWIARAYTLTAVKMIENYYEVTIKREEHGFFSRWLFDQPYRDVMLRISEPQGNFIFQGCSENPAICLVAGIGVTPAIAFIRKWISSHCQNTLYVDYSVRSRKEIIFSDELNTWSDNPGLLINLRITSEQGRLQTSEVCELIKQHPGADIFICGPANYEKNLHEILSKNGVKHEKIHIEQFIHAGVPDHSNVKEP